MLATLLSSTLVGLDGRIIRVEVDVAPGLPGTKTTHEGSHSMIGTGYRSQDPKVTAALRGSLKRVQAMADEHERVIHEPLEIGSGRSADVARSADIGHEVYDLSMDQLAMALDCLIAWRDLIEAGKQPAFAHLSLVRAAMEGAVTVLWLIDGATPDDRVARAAGLLWADYEERRKYENTLGLAGMIKPPAKSAAARQADLEDERVRDGIARVSVPEMTRLFALYGKPSGAPGESLYRLLSAHSHGRRWRLLLNPKSLLGRTISGALVVRTTANDEMSMAMTELSVGWTERALGSVRAYVRK